MRFCSPLLLSLISRENETENCFFHAPFQVTHFFKFPQQSEVYLDFKALRFNSRLSQRFNATFMWCLCVCVCAFGIPFAVLPFPRNLGRCCCFCLRQNRRRWNYFKNSLKINLFPFWLAQPKPKHAGKASPFRCSHLWCRQKACKSH